MNLSNCSQTRAFMDDGAYWRPEMIDLRIPAINMGYDSYPNTGVDISDAMVMDFDGRIPDSVVAEVPGGGALVVQLPGPPVGPEFLPRDEADHLTRIPQSGQLQRGRGNPLYRNPGYTQEYSSFLDCAPGMVTAKAQANQNQLWGPELDATKRLVLERPMPSIVRATQFPDETVSVVKIEPTVLWLLAGVAVAMMISKA